MVNEPESGDSVEDECVMHDAVNWVKLQHVDIYDVRQLLINSSNLTQRICKITAKTTELRLALPNISKLFFSAARRHERIIRAIFQMKFNFNLRILYTYFSTVHYDNSCWLNLILLLFAKFIILIHHAAEWIKYSRAFPRSSLFVHVQIDDDDDGDGERRRENVGKCERGKLTVALSNLSHWKVCDGFSQSPLVPGIQHQTVTVSVETLKDTIVEIVRARSFERCCQIKSWNKIYILSGEQKAAGKGANKIKIHNLNANFWLLLGRLHVERRRNVWVKKFIQSGARIKS